MTSMIQNGRVSQRRKRRRRGKISASSTMNFKIIKNSRGAPKKDRIKSSVENIERNGKRNKSNFDIFYFITLGKNEIKKKMRKKS